MQVGGPRARDVLLALLDRTPQRLQPLDPELQGGGPPELKAALAGSRHHLTNTWCLGREHLGASARRLRPGFPPIAGTWGSGTVPTLLLRRLNF